MPDSHIDDLLKTAQLRWDLLREGDSLEVIVKYHGDITELASSLGVEVEILNSTYAIITLELPQLAELYSHPNINYIELPRVLSYYLQNALLRSCIPVVQSQAGLGLSGEGVLVGIIDSGIDYTHPDFRNPDGTSRILALWDQTIPGNPPNGFLHGTEYTQADINQALASPNPYAIVPSRDDSGHGTAVAGVAAGNGRASNGFGIGVAPRSELVVVKLGHTTTPNFARDTEIMRGLKFIVDTAMRYDRPVAINISYGTHLGPHDGTSLFEAYIDAVSETWKTSISIAAGNEATAGHHFSGMVTQHGMLNAEFVTAGNLSRLFLVLNKNFVDTLTFELISPSGESTGIITQTDNVLYAPLQNVNVSIVYNQPTQYTPNQMIFFQLDSINGEIPLGIWNLVIRGSNVVDGRVDIWLPTVDYVGSDASFLQPDIYGTLTLPATSKKGIAVGGYNSEIGVSADFSGRGFLVDVPFIRPDIVAPAVNILVPAVGGGYDSATGTSIASPFVAGSAALMMQWGIVEGNDPFLYGQRIKAFLQKGARRNFDIPYPNPVWGYGALCLNDTMYYLIEYV